MAYAFVFDFDDLMINELGILGLSLIDERSENVTLQIENEPFTICTRLFVYIFQSFVASSWIIDQL